MSANKYDHAMSAGVDLKTLEVRAEQLVAAALKAGADAADAYVGLGQSQSVSVRNGKTEVSNSSESDSFTLRVFVGDKHASVASNMAGEEQMLAERAVAMAKVSPDDPLCVLATQEQLTKELPHLDLFDPTMVGAEQLAEMAKEAEAAALAVEGVTNTNSAGAGRAVGGMVLATSNGFLGSNVSSSFSCGISAVAGEGVAMQRDHDFTSERHFADLASMAQIGKNAGERTVARLNPTKPKTGSYKIILDKRCSNSMLGHLAGAINGASIARKTSFLKDFLGQAIMNENICITDDPLILRGHGSRPCDGEGVANGPLQLVKDGVLQTWLLDCSSAKELGLETNGRSSRGAPGVTNLYMRNGSRSLEDMLADIGDGLYVTDFIGSGVNGVTGNYSRGISGFLIENGELTAPISEVTIAGNLKDMFKALEPANDLEMRYSVNAPSLYLGELPVAGS